MGSLFYGYFKTFSSHTCFNILRLCILFSFSTHAYSQQAFCPDVLASDPCPTVPWVYDWFWYYPSQGSSCRYLVDYCRRTYNNEVQLFFEGFNPSYQDECNRQIFPDLNNVDVNTAIAKKLLALGTLAEAGDQNFGIIPCALGWSTISVRLMNATCYHYDNTTLPVRIVPCLDANGLVSVGCSFYYRICLETPTLIRFDLAHSGNDGYSVICPP